MHTYISNAIDTQWALKTELVGMLLVYDVFN